MDTWLYTLKLIHPSFTDAHSLTLDPWNSFNFHSYYQHSFIQYKMHKHVIVWKIPDSTTHCDKGPMMEHSPSAFTDHTVYLNERTFRGGGGGIFKNRQRVSRCGWAEACGQVSRPRRRKVVNRFGSRGLYRASRYRAAGHYLHLVARCKIAYTLVLPHAVHAWTQVHLNCIAVAGRPFRFSLSLSLFFLFLYQFTYSRGSYESFFWIMVMKWNLRALS